MVFILPFIPAMLTKARATGYDKKGYCLPTEKVRKIQALQDPIDVEKESGGGIQDLLGV